MSPPFFSSNKLYPMLLNSKPENVSLMMRRCVGLKKRATKPEKHILGLLGGMGIPFMFQKGFCTENRFFIVDFYFPKPLKLCLEIDGPDHYKWSHARYDEARDMFLRVVRGLKVMRIENDYALDLTAPALELLLTSARA